MNGLEMEFSVAFISLGCGLTTDQSFRRTYYYFSFLGYQKFLGFHAPWFQKFVCLEAKIGLCFLPKRWFCLLSFFLFDPYLSLRCSFFWDKPLWQAYVLGYYGHCWTRNGWSLSVRHCCSLLVVCVLFPFSFVQSVKCQFPAIG